MYVCMYVYKRKGASILKYKGCYPEIPYRSAVIIHIIATCIKIYISIYRKDPSNQSNTMSEYSFPMSDLR